MSKGIGGAARLVAQDADTLVYEYYAYNLNEEEYRNPEHIYDGIITILEKTVESPLDCKEIQPVHSEGDQPLDFFGRNDAKAETPVLWPPHVKS